MTSFRWLQLKWFFQRLLKRILRRKYDLSFTEEFWQGQTEGTWIGRIEYWELGSNQHYHDELGIASWDRDGVLRLREKYDCKSVTEKGFLKVQQSVAELNEEEK